MRILVDKYRASRPSMDSVEFTVHSGFVYDAPTTIGWIQGLVLGSALVRLRRMGWKVEKLAEANKEQNPGGPTV